VTPARAVRSVSPDIINELCALEPKWSVQAFKGYQVWHCYPQLGPAARSMFERWNGAFMVRVPPGGMLLKHTDDPKPYRSYHLPIASNERAFSLFDVGGTCVRMHLDVGTLYEYDRTVPHWAENNGDTDRVHLVCEVF
jgi:hypothetical protein